MVKITLDTPATTRHIDELMDIGPVNMPDLLELDVLDGESMYADNVTHDWFINKFYPAQLNPEIQGPMAHSFDQIRWTSLRPYEIS